MSVVGVSPSDIFKGAQIAKKAIEAVSKENGSDARVERSLANSTHEIEALKNFERVLDAVPEGPSPNVSQVRSRVKLLREDSERRKQDISRYQTPTTSKKGAKGQGVHLRKQLKWAFSGEEDAALSTARIACASNAANLDAIL
jgi:hypothetical protein